VRRLVADVRRRLPPETTCQLDFEPGDAAQVDFGAGPTLNRALVHDLATGSYLQEKAPVLIVGPAAPARATCAGPLRGAPGRRRGLHDLREPDAKPERGARHRHLPRRLMLQVMFWLFNNCWNSSLVS
jgi:hypothetical protein